jgi:DNA polymerase III psi subunit
MQNSYLKEMGIDVWVLRGPPQPEASPAVVVENDEPEFHLCFLNYNSFGICLSLKVDEDVLSAESKRFCGDVALAINGGVRRPGINNLKWPVRGGENNSHAAAESVVLQRFMSLPGLVLVFGRDITDYIPDLKVNSIEAADNDEPLRLDGRRFLVMESIDDICSGVEGKRTLWRRLQQLQDLLPNTVTDRSPA